MPQSPAEVEGTVTEMTDSQKSRVSPQSYRNVAFLYILEEMSVLPLGLANSEPSKGQEQVEMKAPHCLLPRPV